MTSSWSLLLDHRNLRRRHRSFRQETCPEIQYLLASITDEQRREFGPAVDATVGQIESAQFLLGPGSIPTEQVTSPVPISACALATSRC